jgi:hypothetical protein
MSNVKHITFPTEDPHIFLKQTLNDMPEDALAVLVAIKLPDGEWMTGHCNLGFGGRMEALGHLHADIIDQMILSNADRYGLHTHDE